MAGRVLAAFLGGCFLLGAGPAQAYIGPGIGVAMIWTLLGPLAGIITLIAIVAYYPLRYLYKKHKKKKALEEQEAVVAEQGAESSADGQEKKAGDE